MSLFGLSEVALAGESGLESGPISATFGPKTGLILDTPAGDVELGVHIATWFRFDVRAGDGIDAIPQLSVPLVRPLLDLKLLSRKIRVLLQPELAGANPRLLDAFIEFRLAQEFVLRVGQFRTPYSRSFISPIIKLQFPDRGVVVDEFRLGRDTGVMAHGKLSTGRFEYQAGLFNGARINDFVSDVSAPAVILRLVYNIGSPVAYDQVPSAGAPPQPGLALGLGGAYRRRQEPTNAQQTETLNVSTDIAAVVGSLSLNAEGHVRETRDINGPWSRNWGAFIQGGLFVIPKSLELAARFGIMSPDGRSVSDALTSYEAGLNAYWDLDQAGLGHHLKTLFRYGLIRTNRPFNGLTGAEQQHRVTLQVQLWM